MLATPAHEHDYPWGNGQLLLQPMIEAIWERAASKGEKRSRRVIGVADSKETDVADVAAAKPQR